MELFQGFKRTDYCGTFTAVDIDREVSVCGWVQRRRDLGGLIFITVRDRSGIVQCTFDQTYNRDLFDKASKLRSEYVVAVRGTVRSRGSDAINKEMATGEIEILADELRILSESETTPFEIVDGTKANDALKLKYRYLDLRRPEMQRNIELRHRAAQLTRNFFSDEGFYEIETPMLTKSTPEGARDYLVPSRVHPGSFYALPQSPQQYKQILMIAGFDKYMQIVRCFRDEDLRADRQPEFTQIDLEMSFVDTEDILSINERYIQRLFRELLGVEVEVPFIRMPFIEAMERFGSDKPDIRFGMEIKNISDIAGKCGFRVFSSAVEAGGSVRLINAEGAASMTRKEIDSLTEFVKTYGAKGLAWLKLQDGQITSSFSKFLSEEETNAIIERAGAKDGDILFVVADSDDEAVLISLGQLRVEIAKRLDMLRKDDFRFLWVTEFPLFEWSEEENRLVARHHPFTSPMDEDIELFYNDPAKCRAKAYDMVLNGTELGGGSIRICQKEMQNRMFEILGFTQEEAQARFGHLLDAFKYGTPPHGGLAFGFDRIVMLMSGSDSLREVIPFPKVQNASELMTQCPATVDEAQLEELGIAIIKKKKSEDNE
ncbi:MAG: aspartate--tRNA ligase [Clostridiales bacterium]|nr:aspartate--tRNA ligase [Clostridiales bacterium]